MSREQVTLLLDSDIIAYKHAAAHQRSFHWEAGEPASVAVGELDDAIRDCADYIEKLRRDLKASEVIVCLSCASADGWRRAILPTYKANRGEKPELLAGVKDWMREHYPFYERPTLEADDIMGILSTHPKLVPGKKIIVSEDKDLMTIPGWLFNPRKHTRPVLVSERDADYMHMMQALVGDATDNYKGCPGIGKVRAEKILLWAENDQRLGATIWERVVDAFVSKGLTEADALVQARVARICRHTDYDFNERKVKLWQPPKQ